MLENFDPQLIQDIEGARKSVILFLNLVEELKQENQAVSLEIQRLRDENNNSEQTTSTGRDYPLS